MSDYAYEMQEAREFQQQLREVEKAPLADRKEAAAEFLEAMQDDPERVGERVGWLLDGNYGYGAMQAAKRVLKNTRSNRAAQLTHMVAALDWQCPARAAMAAWKKLSAAQKAALDKEVNAVIRAVEKGE